MDFASNIQNVKEVRLKLVSFILTSKFVNFFLSVLTKQNGWYWGPISSEADEKILSNDRDGSVCNRYSSSDDHYIFSLTFKLYNCVRHVWIKQNQGIFSFGSCAKFKSRTITEFIENAVDSSRSGR